MRMSRRSDQVAAKGVVDAGREPPLEIGALDVEVELGCPSIPVV